MAKQISQDSPGLSWPEGGRYVLAVNQWEEEQVRARGLRDRPLQVDGQWVDLQEDVSRAFLHRDLQALRLALRARGAYLLELIARQLAAASQLEEP